jgi:hypothetical protein
MALPLMDTLILYLDAIGAALFGEELAIADSMTLDMDDLQAMMAWLFRSR